MFLSPIFKLKLCASSAVKGFFEMKFQCELQFSHASDRRSSSSAAHVASLKTSYLRPIPRSLHCYDSGSRSSLHLAKPEAERRHGVAERVLLTYSA